MNPDVALEFTRIDGICYHITTKLGNWWHNRTSLNVNSFLGINSLVSSRGTKTGHFVRYTAVFMPIEALALSGWDNWYILRCGILDRNTPPQKGMVLPPQLWHLYHIVPAVWLEPGKRSIFFIKRCFFSWRTLSCYVLWIDNYVRKGTGACNFSWSIVTIVLSSAIFLKMASALSR